MSRIPGRAVHALGRVLVAAGLLGTIGLALIRYTGLQERGFRMMGIAGTSVELMAAAAAVGLLGALLVLLGRRRPTREAAAALLCALLPIVLLVQMTAPTIAGAVRPERASEGAGFSVLAQNLWFENEDPGSTLDALLRRRPDVLVLTEYTPEFQRLLDRGPAAEEVRARYPYQWRRPEEIGAGLAVLSAVPFDRAVPVPLTNHAVRIELRVGDERVELYAIHPVAPSDMWGLLQWQHDYRVLTSEVRGARPDTVIAGDFNATNGHRAFRRILAVGDLRDAHDVGGGGLAGTWPVGGLLPPLMRLDHVLVGSGIGVERFEMLDDIGSDHRGVEAWLRV